MDPSRKSARGRIKKSREVSLTQSLPRMQPVQHSYSSSLVIRTKQRVRKSLRPQGPITYFVTSLGETVSA